MASSLRSSGLRHTVREGRWQTVAENLQRLHFGVADVHRLDVDRREQEGEGAKKRVVATFILRVVEVPGLEEAEQHVLARSERDPLDLRQHKDGQGQRSLRWREGSEDGTRTLNFSSTCSVSSSTFSMRISSRESCTLAFENTTTWVSPFLPTLRGWA